MKQWRAILALGLQCVVLTGCWSSSPIEDLNMEVGVAMDTAEETGTEQKFDEEGGGYPRRKKLSCTYQFIIPQGAVGPKKDASASKNFLNMTETGDSIFEAVRELSLRTNRPPIGHHLKTIVVGEQLARTRNLSELIEFFSRDNDIRPSVLVLVSKGRARDVFSDALPGQTPAFVMEGIFKNRDRNTRIWDRLSMAKAVGLLHGKTSFVLQNVVPAGKELKFAGAGVIKGKTGKLIGFLNESELEGLVWLTGKGKGGFLKTYDPGSDQLITYEVKSMTSKIKAIVRDGQISFEVKIKSDGRFAEAFAATGEKLDDAFIKKEQETLQQQAKDLLKRTLDKMQHELQVDAAGFGTQLHIQHPAVWRKVKKEWDETFSKLPITYDVKINIEEYGASITTTE